MSQIEEIRRVCRNCYQFLDYDGTCSITQHKIEDPDNLDCHLFEYDNEKCPHRDESGCDCLWFDDGTCHESRVWGGIRR